MARHPALASGREKELGYRLMFTESEVLLAILERLMGMGITALPLHEGLLAARSKARFVEWVLQEVAKEATGVALPTTLTDL